MGRIIKKFSIIFIAIVFLIGTVPISMSINAPEIVEASEINSGFYNNHGEMSISSEDATEDGIIALEKTGDIATISISPIAHMQWLGCGAPYCPDGCEVGCFNVGYGCRCLIKNVVRTATVTVEIEDESVVTAGEATPESDPEKMTVAPQMIDGFLTLTAVGEGETKVTVTAELCDWLPFIMVYTVGVGKEVSELGIPVQPEQKRPDYSETPQDGSCDDCEDEDGSDDASDDGGHDGDASGGGASGGYAEDGGRGHRLNFLDVQISDIESGVITADEFSSIYYAVDVGWVNGYADNTFRPTASVTRAEMAILLYRLYNSEFSVAAGSGSNSKKEVSSTHGSDFASTLNLATAASNNSTSRFSDVTKKSVSAGAYKAILWAEQAGIIKGYSDGTFRPQETITGTQVAIMMYRLAGKPEVSASGAQRALVWAELHLIMSDSDETFDPGAAYTRARTVTSLVRFREVLEHLH